MRLPLATLAPICLLAGACSGADDTAAERQSDTPAASQNTNGADAMASNDTASSSNAPGDGEALQTMQAQVVLERLGFATGVIDGREGPSFATALKGFQESRNLPVTGTFNEATREALAQWSAIPATRVVTIPSDWGQATYSRLPDAPAEQAKLATMGYESLVERLAERFHTTTAVLTQLNPESATVAFAPGQQIRVPNVGADRIDASKIDNESWLATLRSLGVGTDQPTAAQIVVDESEGWLKAYDANDKLLAIFTVTTGSRHDPLPIGNWGIKGKAYNPPYAFDPDRLRKVPDSAGEHQLPPGPNGPVGVVWIDLTKDHYGIHGTPSPETIGNAESNGCVRLTNWDAARLAQMVSGSTKVEFRK